MRERWIQICPMDVDDIPEVQRINQVCFHDAWKEAAFHDLFAYETNRYYVAMISNKICGFAGSSVSIDVADVVKIGVNPEERQQGVAQALLQELLIDAKKHGCRQMMLEVRESNHSARRLYQKNLFQELAVRKAYYRNPIEDGIVMSRELTDISTIRH